MRLAGITLVALLCALGWNAAPLHAQAAPGGPDDALQRHHAAAADLLSAIAATEAWVLESLRSDRRVDANELVARLMGAKEGPETGSSSAKPGTLVSSMPSLALESPRLVAILERTYSLRRAILAIHAEPAGDGSAPAANRAIELYLSQPGLSLPPIRESAAHGAAAHVGSFERSHPDAHRLVQTMRSFTWDMLAELVHGATFDQRVEGVTATVARFESSLLPDARAEPMEYRGDAARRLDRGSPYPRLDAILDRLHQLQDALLDLLATDPDRFEEQIDGILKLFVEPGPADAPSPTAAATPH